MRERDFDFELDAALAKYAAVEPRAGLEHRVLANLRAERERAVQREWWRGRVFAGTATAAAIVGALILWRGESVRPAPVAVIPARHVDEVGRARDSAGGTAGIARAAIELTAKPVGRHEKVRAENSSAEFVSTDAPKLEQFPAPEPLSDREKLLLQYVDSDRANAELVAETTELAEERMSKVISGGADAKNSGE
jgi:hypothetical protein